MAQELKAYNVVATVDVNPEVVDSLGCTEWAAYDADEVDAVLAEKDAAIAKLNAENERLKKCEIWMKQHFYCEEVIACESAKNRRLKRALWLARAERANESHFMWCQFIYDRKYGIVKFNVRKEWGENVKQGQMLHTPQGWADVWEEVERKCRAKAEEYK